MPGSSVVNHDIMSSHGPDRRGEEASGTIGVGVSGVQYRFLADNPFPVYHFCLVERIEYLPVPGEQLDGILALVLDGNMVAKGKMLPVVLEECAFKTGSYRNFYAFRYLSDHEINRSKHFRKGRE